MEANLETSVTNGGGRRDRLAMATAAATDDGLVLDLWSRDLARDHGFEPLRVEGTLPAGLRGTLYRNGPGQFGQFGRRYRHPFEGDGAVTAVRIADGRAAGASHITPTAGLVAERSAEKMLYGLSVPWPRRIANLVRGQTKNTANTSVAMWQGRLFALMEGGLPTELDPATLAMVGESDLGGVVRGMFSAHPHRVDSRATLYNFGIEYGRHTTLHCYALPDAGPARHLAAIPLAGPPMLHDFIATDTHLVFFVSPVRLSVPRMLLGAGSFEQMFQWRPEHGVDVICVPIDRPDEVVRFTTDAFFQWHFANAYTRSATTLVVDYVRYPNHDTFHAIGDYSRGVSGNALAGGRYHRATIDLAAKTLRSRELSELACEFPTVGPGVRGAEHARAYAVFGDLDTIGAIETIGPATGRVTAHTLASGERASEPLHVDGHLLSLCHAKDAAYVAVYDATRIPDGPVAKIWIDHHVPITFHGVFAPA